MDLILETQYYVDETASVGLFSVLYAVALMVPSLSVLARRLHDIWRSGWRMLIGLIPIIGETVLLVFTVRDSQEGENRYCHINCGLATLHE